MTHPMIMGIAHTDACTDMPDMGSGTHAVAADMRADPNASNVDADPDSLSTYRAGSEKRRRKN
jgi:hypothetical protein